jgi:Tfp pilus assembly protein PilF
MTTRTYMGNDVRRDHSFRIPRPDQSVIYGTPNACTSCHKNQKPAWAADQIKKWYGPDRAYHFSDDLLPGSLLNEKSESHLIKLLADTTQPEIARATSAHYLADVQTQNSATALIKVLNDRKALVRHQALRSLKNFPPQLWIQPAQNALRDKVRAVRIAAADLYHLLPPGAMPANIQASYQSANAENQKYLNYQTDFAVGNVMLADYELQGEDYLSAITHYIRGLKKDSLMNYARLNLSSAYNNVGKNDEALRTLNEAAAIDPGNGRINYNLALLQYEMKDVAAATNNFKNAIQKGYSTPGLYYNYGLLLQQQGKPKDAEQIFLTGFQRFPQAPNINYGLAYYYASQNDRAKAQKHARLLQQLDPGNPQYQELFRNLGL